jgi:hypothetical protein
VDRYEDVAQHYLFPKHAALELSVQQRAVGADAAAMFNLQSVPSGYRLCDFADGSRCLAGRKPYCPQCQLRATNAQEYDSALRDALTALDQAATQSPGDRWVIGQRVYLLLDSGDSARARTAAGLCRVTEPVGWCGMLRVYTLHRTGESVVAAQQLAHTMAEMPSGAWCRWMDMAVLILDGDRRAHYRGRPCAERLALEERLWWLADPSYLVPGNDRWVEHAARRMFLALFDDWSTGQVEWLAEPISDRASGPTVTRTVRDTMVTSGWFDSWGREVAGGEEAGRDSADGHPLQSWHPVRAWVIKGPIIRSISDIGYRFIPRMQLASGPLDAIAPESWSMTRLRVPPSFFGTNRNFGGPGIPPVEAFKPAYSPVWDLAAYQVARFPRGPDSMVVVAATDTRSDSMLRAIRAQESVQPPVERNPAAAVGWTAGLILSTGPSASEQHMVTLTGPLRNRYVFENMVAQAPHLLGIEILGPGPKGLARTRFGLAPLAGPAQRIRVSDLLLFEPSREWMDAGGRARPSLADVKPLMYGTTALSSATAQLGLYWELTGVAATDSLSMALEGVRTDRSFFGSLATRLHLSGGGGGVSLRWTEPPAAGGVATGSSTTTSAVSGRSVIVALNTLDPGSYTLTLTVRAPNQQPVTATRALTITPR